MQNLKTFTYNDLVGPTNTKLLEDKELTDEEKDLVNSLDRSTVYALLAVDQHISPTPKLPTVWKWCGF